MARRFRLLLIATVIALTGCKEVLYSDLKQAEANQMVAVLAASQIAAGRERAKDGTYAVLVGNADVAVAVALLRDQGLPREQFESLGQVFGADGIVGTPFEEQARFLHAMNQELSSTLTGIAGIRSADVLVNLPPKERFQTDAPRASASVALHHEADFDGARHVSVIKNLVAHAMTGLDYDDVEVALFPARGPLVTVSQTLPVASSEGEAAMDLLSERPFLIGGVLAAMMVILLLLAPGFRRRVRDVV